MKKILFAMSLILTQPCFATPEAARTMQEKLGRFYDEQDSLTDFHSQSEGSQREKMMDFARKLRNFNQNFSQKNFEMTAEMFNTEALTREEKDACSYTIKIRQTQIQGKLMDKLEAVMSSFPDQAPPVQPQLPPAQPTQP